jgi:hypothetical protein
MDRETLHAHATHWSEEPVQVRHDLPRLQPDEHALFDDLRANRIPGEIALGAGAHRLAVGDGAVARNRLSAPRG